MLQHWLLRVSLNPPFRCRLLAVLLVVSILRDDELWFQGDDPIAGRGNQDGDDYVVEVDVGPLRYTALGAVLAGDLL